MDWILTHKGDQICRSLADRHYSRQHPGHPMFTRPGYNMVLRADTEIGHAVWVWFRPKWESGIKGTERKDKLHAIECTLFRNESGILSSELIRQASAVLLMWDRAQDVVWEDGAITGIKTSATEKRRGKGHEPGYCYRMAGWVPFEHNASKRADVWLRLPVEDFPDPEEPIRIESSRSTDRGRSSVPDTDHGSR